MPTFSIPRETYIRLHVPENAVPVDEGSGLAIAYVYTTASGRPAATAFIGKRSKPAWIYSFRSVEKRDEEIAKLFESVRWHRGQSVVRQDERSAGHTLQLGDIVYSTWGYEQTNVDWYRVARVTKNYVWLKSLCAIKTESTGLMSGLTVPGQESTKAAEKHWACGERVSLKHSSASKWDGKPRHYSTYA